MTVLQIDGGTDVSYPTPDEAFASFDATHSVVLVGGKARVIRLREETRTYQLLQPDECRRYYANRHVQEPRRKLAPAFDCWFTSPRRRTYDRMDFLPGVDIAPDGVFNTWRGWGVTPERGDKHTRLLEHIRDGLCRGDTTTFEWVLDWSADLVQRPREKHESALAIRGAQGVGKTMFAQALGTLLGPAYLALGDDVHLTSRFNAWLDGRLLILLDEALFAGDKKTANLMKHLITAPTLYIERKGLEGEERPNYTRFILAGNAEWLLPAGLDERRYLVLDAADTHRQDTAHFGRIVADLQDGGYRHLLHALVNRSYRAIALRTIPETAALAMQKALSLPAIDRWLLDVLLEGELPGDVNASGETPRDVVYEHYAEAARRYGERKVLTRNEFGQKLRARLSGEKTAVVDTRPRIHGMRVRCYQLPSLVESRAAFELTTKLTRDWPRDPDDGESDPEWTASHWAPRGSRCACPACSPREPWRA